MTMALERVQSALAPRYLIRGGRDGGGLPRRRSAAWALVAVKVLRPELAAALGPERFLREIELPSRAVRK